MLRARGRRILRLPYPAPVMRALLLVALVLWPLAHSADAQVRPPEAQDLLGATRAFPEMPREAADLLGAFVPPGQFTFASGTPYNDLEYTLFDTDYMEGETNGFDTFMPVNPSAPVPGTDRVKLVRGVNNLDLDAAYSGPRGDRIILGTDAIPTPFFARGPDGVDNDYAVVQNVDYNAPFLQLRGAPEDYELLYATEAEGVATEGHYLFHTATGTPDLIAFVWPCDVLGSTVSGNPPRNDQALCNASKRLTLEPGVHVLYAQPLAPEAEVPGALAQVGSAGNEVVGGVALDPRGRGYLFGATDASLAGDASGENTAFVAQVLGDGRRGWTTEVAVTNGTLLFDAAADDAHLYVAGRTLGALPGFVSAGRWDGILLKLDLDTGAIVGSQQYGTAALDGFGNVALDGAGGLYVSGAGSASGEAGTDPDYLVAKYDAATLEPIWTVLEAPEASGPIFVSEAWGGLSVAPASGGRPARLLAGGWYMSRGGAAGFLSVYEGIETDAPRRVATATLDSPGQQADWVLDNAIGADGALYAAGYTTGSLGGPHRGEGDAYIARFDADLQNPQIVQVGTPRSDLFRKLEMGPDGALYGVGYTYGDAAGANGDASGLTGDAYVVAFESDLSVRATAQFGTAGEDRGFAALGAGVLLVGGMTEGALAAPSAGAFDGYLAALSTTDLSPLASIPVASAPPPEATRAALTVAPNPSAGPLVVRFVAPASGVARVRVIDALGREVTALHDGPLAAGAHGWAAPDLSAGVYTVRATGPWGEALARATVVR